MPSSTPHQVDVRGDDLQGVDVRVVQGLPHVGTVDEALVDGAFGLLDVHSQARRGVGLRVGVDDQDFLFERGQRGGKVDGGGGLAHAALLVCHCNNFSHNL